MLLPGRGVFEQRRATQRLLPPVMFSITLQLNCYRKWKIFLLSFSLLLQVWSPLNDASKFACLSYKTAPLYPVVTSFDFTTEGKETTAKTKTQVGGEC
jgi:hypothetical protein